MPPKATKTRAASSDRADDPDQEAMGIQTNLRKLRKDRDDKLDKIVDNYDADLEQLKARVLENYRLKTQKRGKQHREEQLAIIRQNVETRQKIEAEMIQLMEDVNRNMGEAEALLREAYNGRERDLKAAMKA